MSNLAAHPVKLILPIGIPPASAKFLAAELIQNGFHHYDFYVPRFNPKMLMFKYTKRIAKGHFLVFFKYLS